MPAAADLPVESDQPEIHASATCSRAARMSPRTFASNSVPQRAGLAVPLVSGSFLGMANSCYATNSGVNWPRQPKRLLRVWLTTFSLCRS